VKQCNKFDVSRLVSRLRPGSGWKCLREPVWEHQSGVRIHWSGDLLRLADGKIVRLTPAALGWSFYRQTRVMQPNRKRWAMAVGSLFIPSSISENARINNLSPVPGTFLEE
jgi:hypothetical protein